MREFALFNEYVRRITDPDVCRTLQLPFAAKYEESCDPSIRDYARDHQFQHSGFQKEWFMQFVRAGDFESRKT